MNATKIIFVAVLFALVSMSYAAIPNAMNIQGRIRTSTNAVASNGYYNLTFRIYNQTSGGAVLWTESQNQTVTNGYYDVVLGTVTPLNLTFNQSYFLSLQINTDTEATPRINLTTTPYAFRANVSEDLDCTDCIGATEISDVYVLNTGDSIAGDLTPDVNNSRSLGSTTLRFLTGWFINLIALQDLNATNIFATSSFSVNNNVNISSNGNTVIGRNLTVGSNVLFVDTLNNRVGIGTTTPDETLTVSGAIRTTILKDAFGWETHSRKQAELGLGTDHGGFGSSVSPGNVFNRTSSWSTFDAGANGIGTDPDGYRGAVFDGRYIYFVPWYNGAAYHGEVLRYDTAANFTINTSWSTFDPSSNGVGQRPRGYSGAAFDGRYIYFAPYNNGTAFHSEVLRYDTTTSFTSNTSWDTFNAKNNGIGTTVGYNGALFDGRYVYFVPFYNGATYHSEVLRYDTTTSFTSNTSWSAFDVQNNGIGTTPIGYSGAVFDGRFIYFVPEGSSGSHGEVLRLDTTGTFNATSSWSTFDAGANGVGQDPDG
ncbi:MAG: hypothetical protein HY832_02255, partial [Candidatus Aenigmarchaeota archaeon]|nr:hypothetical protein [Candidatus Aenigmarchaeota archaeon]